jgi:hypothetical protein
MRRGSGALTIWAAAHLVTLVEGGRFAEDVCITGFSVEL